ncbi:RNase H family protein [Mesorhizobium newzealandense]|uniref:RNase H family protein n=1 Tax=Mesorhizobium newzealandense TaxID=1300302 RepID=A0ABW4ULW4_9HYPH
MDGIQWIHGWKKNGWKTPTNSRQEWRTLAALDEANRRHKVTWNWVKGHLRPRREQNAPTNSRAKAWQRSRKARSAAAAPKPEHVLFGVALSGEKGRLAIEGFDGSASATVSPSFRAAIARCRTR